MNNQRWFIIIGAAFLLVTGLMLFTSKAGTQDTFIGKSVRFVAKPVEVFMYKLNRYAREVWLTLVELGRLREDNKKMMALLAELSEENKILKVYQKENETLRETLSLKRELPHTTEAAEVIAYNPNNYFATVTINKGTESGLKEGMVAVTKSGLVGRITQVQKGLSQVMLISDGQHTVGGIVVRTNDLVKVVGYPERSGFCKVIPMENELFKVKLRKGDTVITWEQSEYFPKGLSIGKVVGIVKTSSGSIGIMRPSADLNHLQVILIIKD